MQHLEPLRASARGAGPHPMALDSFTELKGRRRQGWPRGRSYRDQVLRGNTLRSVMCSRLRCGGWCPDREEGESRAIFEILRPTLPSCETRGRDSDRAFLSSVCETLSTGLSKCLILKEYLNANGPFFSQPMCCPLAFQPRRNAHGAAFRGTGHALHDGAWLDRRYGRRH